MIIYQTTPFQVTRGSPPAVAASSEAKHALICLRDVSQGLLEARATSLLHRDGKNPVNTPLIREEVSH